MKNGTVLLSDGKMDYIRFGRGQRHLIMLPGLGDSLRSVKGTAAPMALMYRIFAKDFTVWMFSRKQPLKQLCSTRELARDQAEAMDALGIPRADIFGVSMGGMIAQWLAADYPEKTGKLVLAVTSPRPNPILTESIEEWVTFAKKDDPAGFMDSNLRRIYTPANYRRNRWTIPLLGKLTKPKSYARFLTMAQACLDHDAHEGLSRIQSPTLVVGGGKDQSLGGEASKEIAAAIQGAELRMYEQWGHGLYEEAKDFNKVVIDFLLE